MGNIFLYSVVIYNLKEHEIKEVDIINHLSIWIKEYFKKSNLLVAREVSIQLGEEIQDMRTDLIAIQSKSNIIHAFEIKNKCRESNLNSIIWQVDSLYGNYKWLVTDEDSKNNIPLELFEKKGLGLIIFKSNNLNIANVYEFEIIVNAKYVDGNLLNYYPSLIEAWNKKKKHASK